ncbi:SDR family NAD(P)-dependent oxidoreductase [Schumannella sp. 10F1B-5-1]|uniref:SDR family NAD(P)-dependent oxidoreductase n=1 Tax=Schumannella sp. 10F1B-5-1 TaxID=2590780 RepID=UPI00112FF944|nr:SDR family oxidoreductase [Schumannella sp. 10F1B-5-1]TPW72933.1 SDR family oxidoreductase [Schumannella sp. 10F1B-5-1]
MSVLVTGAGGGIGSAIAAALEAAGHEVVRHDVRGSAAHPVDIEGDMTDAADSARLVAESERRGVDSVLAAHGIAAARDLAGTDRAFLERAMRINAVSVFHLYDALAERVRASGGAFVVISSQAGLVAEANNGPYCASKFALIGWARGLVAAGGAPRLRVLCPGATETPLLRSAFEGMAASAGISYDQVLAERSASVPAGRLGRPEDLGAAATWLVEVPSPALIVAAVTGGEVLS